MKQKIEEIEVIRGFAALAVVLIHVSASYLQPKGDAGVFMLLGALNALPKFAVQIFIFISGLVLFYTYSEKTCKAGSFYLKRLKYLLVPYAFWTVVYLYNKKGFSSKPIAEQGLLFLQNFLAGHASFHLYFVLLIIQFYLIFPLMQKYVKRFDIGKKLMLWSAIGYLILMYFEYYSVSFGKLLPQNIMMIRSRLFIYWYFYFLLGAYVGINFEAWQKRAQKYSWQSGLLMLASWGLITCEYYISVKYMNVDYGIAATPLKPSIFLYTLVCIFALYSLAQNIVKKDSFFKKFFVSAGKYSLMIYLSHPLALKFVAGWHLSSLVLVNFAVTYILTVAITWGLAMFFSKNKITAMLTGTA